MPKALSTRPCTQGLIRKFCSCCSIGNQATKLTSSCSILLYAARRALGFPVSRSAASISACTACWAVASGPLFWPKFMPFWAWPLSNCKVGQPRRTGVELQGVRRAKRVVREELVDVNVVRLDADAQDGLPHLLHRGHLIPDILRAGA